MFLVPLGGMATGSAVASLGMTLGEFVKAAVFEPGEALDADDNRCVAGCSEVACPACAYINGCQACG